MSEESLESIDQRLLDWILERVAETHGRGSIYFGIENGRLTWINHEKNSRFPDRPAD